ncbi:LOW QUALITY PROTEIN: Dienelactone hydrolase [Colletotrichum higginsianum IMI 349063]|uniref:Dienelactone hydrolase n=1 Tax=Colletotrichum higginsianum (strain IMI 349063) TaxID=759273 RepID=A0A1B7YM95_COLHI|nr:LOW QUALITY PROTEIN: Dienelactone hydrolase [Colletotrichum higginsianum IMI 349063]OBR13175.1 LOW QUALITY PROTEIN: Dienelactone hydrolase [Colletotrichum higginsianum IMI 349063]
MLAINFFSFVLGFALFLGASGDYVADLSLLAFTGTPVGKVVPFDGLISASQATRLQLTSPVDLYVSMPRNQSGKTNGTTARTRFGVLLLTDIYGIQSRENKLFVPPMFISVTTQVADPGTASLVDSFARAGYVAVAPDLFENKPKSEDPMASFNGTEFFRAHGPAVTDPKVEKTIAYMRDKMDIQKIASTG